LNGNGVEDVATRRVSILERLPEVTVEDGAGNVELLAVLQEREAAVGIRVAVERVRTDQRVGAGLVEIERSGVADDGNIAMRIDLYPLGVGDAGIDTEVDGGASLSAPNDLADVRGTALPTIRAARNA
jgi:hypothetical protein